MSSKYLIRYEKYMVIYKATVNCHKTEMFRETMITLFSNIKQK